MVEGVWVSTPMVDWVLSMVEEGGSERENERERERERMRERERIFEVCPGCMATFALWHKARVINLSSGKEEVGGNWDGSISGLKKTGQSTSYRISFVIFPCFLFFLDNMFFDISPMQGQKFVFPDAEVPRTETFTSPGC